MAKECLQLPSLLAEIARELASEEKALVGDCAKVFVKVGEKEPKLLLPYMEQLMSLINN
ncbi:hypothetical protein [Niallia nealsonii]|uniref:hypothetical protein n=1 Tax=Niallia nealsonii TaxID=115979 RepID=UPI0012FEAAD0|nr:hypothetical protein [Niallia nealsonii]